MAARPEGRRDLPRRLQEDAAAQHREAAEVAEAATPSPTAVAARPVRRRLPADRQAVCHKFDIAGHEGYIHVGFYEDGTPGEIFIKMAKEGSTISGLMDTIGVLTSMALQYGVPLEVLVQKFSHVRFEPSGFTKNPDIPMAKSLIDYIFRFLGSRFLGGRARRRRSGSSSARSPQVLGGRRGARGAGLHRRRQPSRARRLRRSPSARRRTRRAAPTAARSWSATAPATNASTAARRAAAPEGRSLEATSWRVRLRGAHI